MSANSIDASYDFEPALNLIPGLVWSSEPDGFCDCLNDPWHDGTGMSLEAAKGWGWQEAIHPDDRQRLVDYWRALLDEVRPGEIEARLRRFDGAYRWFIFRAEPWVDASGRVIKWYGQTTDIDDRK